jgi:metal-responsive CopG/Arc/MetJ family transcriptional regulator
MRIIMKSKKETYNLPIEIVNQLDKLKKETGKSKSKIITELIQNTMTNKNKIKNISHTLPQLNMKKTKLEDLSGFIKLDYETDSVKLKDEIHFHNNGD